MTATEVPPPLAWESKLLQSERPGIEHWMPAQIQACLRPSVPWPRVLRSTGWIQTPPSAKEHPHSIERCFVHEYCDLELETSDSRTLYSSLFFACFVCPGRWHAPPNSARHPRSRSLCRGRPRRMFAPPCRGLAAERAKGLSSAGLRGSRCAAMRAWTGVRRH